MTLDQGRGVILRAIVADQKFIAFSRLIFEPLEQRLERFATVVSRYCYRQRGRGLHVTYAALARTANCW